MKSARKPTIVVAHRGLLLDAPENTLDGFSACLKLGLGFELDVQRSKDGHLVCIHDATVDRTTNGSGPVSQMTLKQLKSLDAGAWFSSKFVGSRIPTIDEVFQLIAEHKKKSVVIAVDFKGADDLIEKDLVALADKHGVLDKLLMIGRTIVSPEVRSRLKAANAGTHVATVANNKGEFLRSLNDKHSDWVYVRYIPSAAEVKQVHDAGKQVFIAGASVAGLKPENWKTVQAAGVDAILTDYSIELSRQLRSQR